MNNSVSPRCSKCGRAKHSQTERPSITNWLRICRCELIDNTTAAPHDSTSRCPVCGKSVPGGRIGSFTQWVFRTDQCQCQRNRFVQAGQMQAPAEKASSESAPVKEPAEAPEIELDPSQFPVARYKPLSIIGQGASSTVYLCLDRLLKKRVAVKCLRVVTAEQLVDFQKEAKATSSLNHPNIIKVFDFGVTDSGAPYMVIEHFNGVGLDRYIAEEGPMQANDAAALFVQLADALEHSHEKGIFHRDLKSSNILLAENGVRIIDFGMAGVKHFDQEPTIVQGRTMVGTPAYMSPDLAMNLPYTRASEIYSLGCVMFECLTGRVPYIGSTSLETIGLHARSPVPKVSEFTDAEVPPELEKLVFQCLQKDPAERIGSMSALRASLQSINEDDEPLVATESSASPSPATPSDSSTSEVRATLNYDLPKRKPPLWTLVASLAMAICLCLWFFQNRIDHAMKSSQEPPPFEVKATPREESILLNWQQWTFEGRVWWKKFGLTDEDLLAEKETIRKFANLSLYEESISARGLEHISDLPLTGLYLRSTDMDSGGIKVLSRMKTLEAVSLDDNRNLADNDLKVLCEGLPDLKYLGLRADRFSDEAMKYVGQLKSLEELNIDGLNLNGSGLRYLTGIPKLRVLRMSNVPIKRKELIHLSTLKSLKTLHLRRAPLDDNNVDLIASLPLEELDVSETKLTLAGMLKLRIPTIKTLYCGNVLEENQLEHLRRGWRANVKPVRCLPNFSIQ